MPDSKPSLWSMMLRTPANYVLVIFVGWWAFVAISGHGFGIGGPWDFSATAQLGDSFGVLSAFMTSMAAIFTYQTLVDTRRQAEIAEKNSAAQQQEIERARLDAAQQREEIAQRNSARDEAEFKRDAERTFFGLLDFRLRLLSEIHNGSKEYAKSGADALAQFLDEIRPGFYESPPFDYGKRYLEMYKSHIDDLAHYFRFTYHVIKFADNNLKDSPYPYIRLLRAQLSNTELILISMNCAHGEGKEKFLPLVEKYSLLHNINNDDRETFDLDNFFKDSAFRSSEY